MKKAFVLKIIFFLTVFVAPTFAQHPQKADSLDSPQAPKYRLEPVVVTATRSERPIYRVPYAINVIEQKDIQRAEIGLSLKEALRAIPGVVVSNRHNLSQGDRISIRGIGSRAPFGVRGLKILLDGIPLTMPDGQSQLNNIDLGSVGKIEILRGPSSALYGNAAGGLIDMQTQNATTNPLGVQPRVTIGSDGLQKWQNKLSGSIGKNSYFVNLTRLNFDGFREHAAAKSTSLNVIGKHNFSERTDFTAVFSFVDSPYLLNPSSLSKADAEQSPQMARSFVKRQGAGKKVRQGQGGMTLRYSDNNANRLQATIYGVWRSLVNPIPGRWIDLDRAAWGVRSVFSHYKEMTASALQLKIGTDYETQRDTRLEFENNGISSDLDDLDDDEIIDAAQRGEKRLDQKETVSGIGPFAELEFAWQTKWILTLGGRYDHYIFRADDRFLQDGLDDSGKRAMSQFSQTVGLTFRPHPLHSFYFHYATAFQTPTTTELGNRPSGAGGFHPDLQPERSRNFELGAKGNWSKLRLGYEAAFFALAIKDMLIPFQVQEATSEEIFFRNAGKAQNKGAELRLTAEVANYLHATFALTFMDFAFKDFARETNVAGVDSFVQLAGKKVPGVPQKRLFAGVDYTLQNGFFVDINLDWTDRYFANDFNGPTPGDTTPRENFTNDSYVKFDVRFGLQRDISGMTTNAFFGIDNLFDKRYNGAVVPNAFGARFFEPAPGRRWFTGMSLEF
jgi:iron complex outermembrane receptor protein